MKPALLLTTALLALGLGGMSACNSAAPPPSEANSDTTGTDTTQVQANCQLVEEGFGPSGSTEVRAEEVVSNLEVPWAVAFLPDGDLLVTERPGRLRLVEGGMLRSTPVATVETTAEGEGGLLGLALHPNFEQNRYFYLYYTTEAGGQTVNRVERWTLASDARSAQPDRVILDGIPASRFHNGGRLRFGPDGMLYIGTGDARNPENAQNRESLAGKLLRLTPGGDVPEGNPFPGNPAFLTGVRNTQGFAWPNDSTLWMTDHGPSGEMGRTGHDEISVAHVGDNLGWPTIYGCQTETGMVTPVLTWDEAVPPGGAAIYTGEAFPDWQGDLIVGTLGSRHLHRVVFTDDGRLQRHRVHLRGDRGRLRAVQMGPDRALYVTTSNCDGRGDCPADGDKILRIVP